VVSTIGNNFYISTSPTEDDLIELDNNLASELAPTAATATTSLFIVLLVFPFNLAKLDNANCNIYDEVTNTYLRSWLSSEWKQLGRKKIGKANMSPFLTRRKMHLMTPKGKPK